MRVDVSDSRLTHQFRQISFSGYNKNKVVKELINALINGEVESACYWGAELICAGHIINLWESLLKVCGENVASSQIYVYIGRRIKIFKNIVHSQGDGLSIRNNAGFRELIAEISAIISLAPKQPSLVYVVPSKESFTLLALASKCKAPNNEYYKMVWEEGDATSLITPINEFVYLVTREIEQHYKICYWIEWIIWYFKSCQKSKIETAIRPRYFMDIPDRSRINPIWLVWQVFWTQAHRSSDPTKLQRIEGLLAMFSLRFTKTTMRKRRCLLYKAAKVLSESDFISHSPITKESGSVYRVVNDINRVYKDVVDSYKPGCKDVSESAQ